MNKVFNFRKFLITLMLILHVISFIKIVQAGAVKNPFKEYTGPGEIDEIFKEELANSSELDRYIVSMNRADSVDYLDHRRGFVYEGGNWVRKFYLDLWRCRLWRWWKV